MSAIQTAARISEYLTTGMHHSTPEGQREIAKLIGGEWLVGAAIRGPVSMGLSGVPTDYEGRPIYRVPVTHKGQPGHHAIIHDMVQNHGVPRVGKGYDQGFITNLGRFMDREEAAEIALNVGQIKALRFHSRELFSEEVWP